MTGSGPADDDGEPADPARLRNIGIVAHINAGKTTLTERILFDTGRQRTLGDVDAGTATTDWLREEQERGISISAAVTRVSWRGNAVQIVDTPGHVDFAAEVERSLRVLDGAVVVLDGVRGVETQTETVWRSIERLAVPRLAFVNKLDRSTADYDACVAGLARDLAARPLPVVVPILEDGVFVGLIDAVGRRFRTWGSGAPPSAERIDACHQVVVEACADRDEQVFAAFVDGRDIDPDALHAVIRRATLAGDLTPVFGGSALRNRGVEPLLDGVCRYLPSPLERVESAQGEGFLALVFKVQIARDGSGPEALIRVYRDRVSVGDEIETAGGERFRVDRVQAVHAMEREDRRAAGAGEIVAIRAPRLLRTGETLRAPGGDEELEPLTFSMPVLATTVEPRSADELPELLRHARELAAEDPTLRIEEDQDRGGVVVRGMGELHLEVFAERLARVLSSAPRLGRPSVVHLETVAAAAEAEAECTRQLGEVSIRAWARVWVEPLPGRSTPVFRWAVSASGAAPELRAEVLAELEARARAGFASPHAVGGVAIEVRELGAGGPPDMARSLIHEAVALACRRAMVQGGLVFAEPWTRIEVVTPLDATGTVLADLRSRGAQIAEVGGDELGSRIRARMPLDRLLGYATALRSMTRGRGRFELRIEGFASS